MSRKFLADNIQGKHEDQDNVPANGTKGFDTGHWHLNITDGKRYENLGNAESSIFANDFVTRYTLVERFLQLPKFNTVSDVPAADTYTTAGMQLVVDANRNFEIVGTNAATATVAFADGGGVTVTTAGGDEDQAILTPHLNTAATSWAAAKWNTNDEVIFETVIKTAASLADQTIWAGLKLTNTSVIATDDHQAFFRYDQDTASGIFRLITSNVDDSTDDQTLDTTVTVAVSTSYHLMIKIGEDLKPRYFINGALVGTGKALKADIDLIPYVGVQQTVVTDTGVLTVRGVACSKTFND